MFQKIALTSIIFLGIDFVWLGIIARSFYDQQLSAFKRTLNPAAAVLVYLLLVMGIVVFVLPTPDGSKLSVFIRGALFGLITYGVYDLTNLALLSDWSATMAVVDMLWGAVLCGTTSWLVFSITG